MQKPFMCCALPCLFALRSFAKGNELPPLKTFAVGGGNNAVAFDLTTVRSTKALPGGETPFAVFYRPVSKRIVVCTGKSKDLRFIDPATDKGAATVAVERRPGTKVGNGKQPFVNRENNGERAAVDSAGKAPAGLAMEGKNSRLSAAGRDTKRLRVTDAASRKIKRAAARRQRSRQHANGEEKEQERTPPLRTLPPNAVQKPLGLTPEHTRIIYLPLRRKKAAAKKSPRWLLPFSAFPFLVSNLVPGKNNVA